MKDVLIDVYSGVKSSLILLVSKNADDINDVCFFTQRHIKRTSFS